MVPPVPTTDPAASATDSIGHDQPGRLARPPQSNQSTQPPRQPRMADLHTRGASMADMVLSMSSEPTAADPRPEPDSRAAHEPHLSHVPRAPPTLPHVSRQNPSQAPPPSYSHQPCQSNHRRSRNASAVSNHLEASGLDLLNVDVSQLQVDSDSSDSDYRPTGHSARAPAKQHARSMSNPFPSLFSAKKKQKKGKSARKISSGFDSSDSSDGNKPLAAHAGADPRSSVAESSGQPSFSTGPCITCGSMMRWVCGATAFRCSICLTINDLAPNKEQPERSATEELKDSGVAGAISVEKTRDLIHECLRAYLEHVLLDVVDLAAGSASCPDLGDIHPPSMAVSNMDGQALGRPVRRVRGPPVPPTGQLTSRRLQHSREPSHPHSQPDRPPQPLSRPCPPTPMTTSAPCIASPPPVAGTRPPAVARAPDEKEAKRIFRPLEDYIVSHILSMDCLDSSFVPVRSQAATQEAPLASSAISPAINSDRRSPLHTRSCPLPGDDPFPAVDIPKMASWRTSTPKLSPPSRRAAITGHQRHASESGTSGTVVIDPSRPILIDWPAVDEWYSVILNAGAPWTDIYEGLVARGACQPLPRIMLEELEDCILTGQKHAQRALLKAVETVLKRPGRRISELGDFRFLIISLANPLLHTSCMPFSGRFQSKENHARRPSRSKPSDARRGTGPVSGQHSVIIKRILGLMSNSPNEWHNRMIVCFSEFSELRFVQIKDLVASFLAYRLVRYNEKKSEARKPDFSDALVPKVAEGASVASYHAALSEAAHHASGSVSRKPSKIAAQKTITHGDDWQIKAAVRVMRLLFIANSRDELPSRSRSIFPSMSSSASTAVATDGHAQTSTEIGRGPGTGSGTRRRGRFLPTSDFYMTLLDNYDLVADYVAWENKQSKFSFCQYPFLLSVWAKIQILEWEARRQMMSKARDAFFDSIMTHRNFDQHLVLHVRRDCLVEDSLTSVSEAIGTGSGDIKKGIRIIFTGEEGIDAGGLRKEWFLLLVRELFNPDHGMFIYDDESQYCYFNPASFETSDQFFLVGVVLGLAIYNSTILDVALPPFVFRRLLLEAPATVAGLTMGLPRPIMKYTLEDLAEFRPSLARGLQQLLDYDGGDVQATFCLDFTVAVERYGIQEIVPLCAGGATRPVTEANRVDYVHLYVQHVLETAVARQFEPFKRGFFTVCGCNALGLFRPEEIELLVRGSDEALDITSLRMAASYDNWAVGHGSDALAREPTLQWFWQTFAEAAPADQRKLLIFITGSDRIPATGPASLSIRILCLGEDTGRYPTARTCFNTLTLYRYTSKAKLQRQLWGAVHESEGFGLK